MKLTGTYEVLGVLMVDQPVPFEYTEPFTAATDVPVRVP